MKGFYVSASGVIQGHYDGPLVRFTIYFRQHPFEATGYFHIDLLIKLLSIHETGMNPAAKNKPGFEMSVVQVFFSFSNNVFYWFGNNSAI